MTNLFASGRLTETEQRFFDYRRVASWLMPAGGRLEFNLQEVPQPYAAILVYYFPLVMEQFKDRSIDLVQIAIALSDWIIENMPSFPGILPEPVAVEAKPEAKPAPAKAAKAPTKREDPLDTSSARFSYIEVD